MDDEYAAWAARWRVPMGFGLGAAYLVFSQPTFKLLAAGGSLALLGVLLRALAAGYLTKNQGLTTSGPYAYTRNPLYLGSFVTGLGLAVAGGSWALGGAFLVFFLAVYAAVMRREAQALRSAFGEAYEKYARDVPWFVPRLRLRGRFNFAHPSTFARGPEQSRREPVEGQAGGEKFQWQRYRKNREYEAALGFLGALLFLVLKAWLR